MNDPSNCLIIAPHPDDEVLGCGGMMARYAAMDVNVYVAIVTNGHLGAPELFKKEGTEKVRSEALKAHSLLGVKETRFLDFPAPRLDTVPIYKVAGAINELIQQYSVDELLIPHRGDIHKDHTISYDASLVAARPVGNHVVKRIMTYETLSETEWAPPLPGAQFIPNTFVSVEPFLENKLEAFRCFTTQVKTFPHPRSEEGITHLARLRGSTVGHKAAEAFHLIRMIKD